MQKLIETETSLKTKITTSPDGTRTYAITKTIESLSGGRGIFVLLYPTRTPENLHVEDSTNVHILNHLKELGLSRYTIINLFSTVTKSKLSTRGLALDKDNMEFIRNNIFKNYNASSDKLIIAWGNSHQTSKTINQAKLEILKMWAEMYQNTEVYQLSANGLAKDNIGVHPLYMGIRFSNAPWKLTAYPILKAIKDLASLDKKEPISSQTKPQKPGSVKK